jgi:hypothetical protein
MSGVRFRIRTIMIVVAALAVLMCLLRWADQIDDTLGIAFLIVLIALFTLYGWFLRKRNRQLSKVRSSFKGPAETGEPERV